MNKSHAVPIASTWPVRSVLAAILGAVVVALSAQVAVPVPGTPVPVTFQAADYLWGHHTG